jgi:DNA polymerase V
MDAVIGLFERIVNPNLLIRRVSISANHVIEESKIPVKDSFEQLNLFTDYETIEAARKLENQALEREKRMQQAVLDIKKKHGKNAILKGMNLQESATTIERNNQIGGHKA